MAAVLVRPDAAQAAILAALHDAERMLDDLVSRVVPRLPATEENLDRRAVGKLLFLAPNARLLAALGVLDRLPPDPLDGLASTRSGTSPTGSPWPSPAPPPISWRLPSTTRSTA